MICEMSCSEWIRVSSTLRSTAMPMPSAARRGAEREVERTFGLDAAAGTVAGWIVSICTRLAPPQSGFSRSFTDLSPKLGAPVGDGPRPALGRYRWR